MDNKIRRYLRLFPVSTAISMDLLVWVAVNTLFLSAAKGFTDEQIVLSSTIALWGGILLQYPVIRVMRLLGNTWSFRAAAICYLTSALMVTFCKEFYLVVAGLVILQVAYTFTSVSDVMLQNNLELIDREEDFVRYRTKANTIYATTTMIIAIVASPLFTINYYLPMFCSITFCITGLVLSFIVKDYSPYDRISGKPEKAKKLGSLLPKYSSYVWLLLIGTSLASAVMTVSQSEGKLFVQQTLLTEYDIEKTAYLLGIAVLISRIARVLANLFSMRLQRWVREYLYVFLNGILLGALSLLVIGFLLPIPLIFRFIIMGFGFSFTLFSWDIYHTHAKKQMLMATPHEQHQTIMTAMTFGRRITNAMINTVMTVVILQASMLWAIIGLAGLGVVQLLLNIYLLRFQKAKV